jgi:hypothetical protein
MRTNVQVVLALVASAGLVSVVHAQAKVDLEYKPQKGDGTLDAGVQFKYDIRSQKSAARAAKPGSKGPGAGQGQAGFGYGSAPGSKADAGAKGKGTAAEAAAHGKDVAASASGGKAGGSAAAELNPTQARQTPKTDFGSVMRDGLVSVPDVAKTPTPGGPVPLPYPNTPIDVKPPVVKAPLPILRPIDAPRPILAPTPLPIIAQPVPVAPKPVIVEPVPQPAIKLPYSAPVNRR